MRWECETKTDSVSCYDCFSCRFWCHITFTAFYDDAVTGATPKSKKAAQASAQLEGSYVLGINMMSDGLDNENTRNKLKELALDDSEQMKQIS